MRDQPRSFCKPQKRVDSYDISVPDRDGESTEDQWNIPRSDAACILLTGQTVFSGEPAGAEAGGLLKFAHELIHCKRL
jgi:hypothetical protein